MSLESKILFIQTSVDQHFRLILNKKWGSENLEYRRLIRQFLSQNMSHHFSREQLVSLSDLNQRPKASDGTISISHCKSLGGFSFSKLTHGFDVEEMQRISQDILKRTCNEQELAEAPSPNYLWVAKEACFKAMSTSESNLVMNDFHCQEWQSHFENQIYSCRMNSKKALDFGLNKIFVFSEQDFLISFFFK